jgi:hypothetical protein
LKLYWACYKKRIGKLAIKATMYVVDSCIMFDFHFCANVEIPINGFFGFFLFLTKLMAIFQGKSKKNGYHP